MEDYDKQIEILSKTRGLLQLIRDSTESVYKDIDNMNGNNKSINKTCKNTLDLVRKI